MNLNKVIVAGRLTANPEFKTLTSGHLTTFTVAMNRRWKNDAGEPQEEVCFIGVKVFGPRAAVINNYFKKGNKILVEGHLRQETWEKDGKKNSKHVIMLDNFSFVDSKGGEAPSQDVPEGAELIPGD